MLPISLVNLLFLYYNSFVYVYYSQISRYSLIDFFNALVFVSFLLLLVSSLFLFNSLYHVYLLMLLLSFSLFFFTSVPELKICISIRSFYGCLFCLLYIFVSLKRMASTIFSIFNKNSHIYLIFT